MQPAAATTTAAALFGGVVYLGMLVFVFVALQTWLSYGADECPARP